MTVCETCGTRVIGHGVENEDRAFSGAQCAGEQGGVGATNNV